jgi:L-amino acid N-acyltransferase YncA
MLEDSREIGVRLATTEDAESLARIYNFYVLESTITFEEEAVSPADMASRIQDVHSTSLPWLIAQHKGRVLGYALATRWKGRCAYRFSTEVTVYVDHAQVRGGIGSKLYSHLLPALKSCEVHVVIGGIALPNDASVRLHEYFGFEKVAQFKEIGFKFGRWIDVGYWQRML